MTGKIKWRYKMCASDFSEKERWVGSELVTVFHSVMEYEHLLWDCLSLFRKYSITDMYCEHIMPVTCTVSTL